MAGHTRSNTTANSNIVAHGSSLEATHNHISNFTNSVVQYASVNKRILAFLTLVVIVATVTPTVYFSLKPDSATSSGAAGTLATLSPFSSTLAQESVTSYASSSTQTSSSEADHKSSTVDAQATVSSKTAKKAEDMSLQTSAPSSITAAPTATSTTYSATSAQKSSSHATTTGLRPAGAVCTTDSQCQNNICYTNTAESTPTCCGAAQTRCPGASCTADTDCYDPYNCNMAKKTCCGLPGDDRWVSGSCWRATP